MPSNGIEPLTYWLQVSCSTNWAKKAYLMWYLQMDLNHWPLSYQGSALTNWAMKVYMVRIAGFKPATFWSQIRRDNQATLYPDILNWWPIQDSHLWSPAWKADVLTTRLIGQLRNGGLSRTRTYELIMRADLQSAVIANYTINPFDLVPREGLEPSRAIAH